MASDPFSPNTVFVEEPKPTIDPDGRSISYFQLLSYKLPLTIDTPPYAIVYKDWFQDFLTQSIILVDGARHFDLERMVYQFDVQIAQFLKRTPPEPLVIPEWEEPTQLAYETRKRKLMANGYAPLDITDNDDDNNDHLILPEEILIEPFPSTLDLNDEQKDNVAKLLTVWYDGFRESELYKMSRQQLIMGRSLLTQLASNDGWEVVREDEKTITYYRSEEGLSTCSFKVVGNVQAEAIDLFSLLYEVTQFKEWFPNMNQASLVYETTRYIKGAHSILHSPWPVSNRDLLLDCSGIDDSSRGRVLINMQDLSKENEYYFPPDSKHVRCSMHHGGFMITPLKPDLTEIAFYSNVDPQLSLPSYLINFITGKMVHILMPTMEEWAKKVPVKDSPWQLARQDHPLVYNDVQTALEIFFKKDEPATTTTTEATTTTTTKSGDESTAATATTTDTTTQ